MAATHPSSGKFAPRRHSTVCRTYQSRHSPRKARSPCSQNFRREAYSRADSRSNPQGIPRHSHPSATPRKAMANQRRHQHQQGSSKRFGGLEVWRFGGLEVWRFGLIGVLKPAVKNDRRVRRLPFPAMESHCSVSDTSNSVLLANPNTPPYTIHHPSAESTSPPSTSAEVSPSDHTPPSPYRPSSANCNTSSRQYK